MKCKSGNYLMFALLIFLILQNFVSGQTPSAIPENLTENKSDEIEADLIHLGDLIDVDVVGSVEYDWRGTLNPEGFLSGINFTEDPIYGLCRTKKLSRKNSQSIQQTFTRPASCCQNSRPFKSSAFNSLRSSKNTATISNKATHYVK